MHSPTLDRPTSLVTFLLDRSWSMLKIKGATLEGFNGYLYGLQNEPDADIDFTFLTFDTISLDKIYVATPIKQVAMLTEDTYQPRDGTPLIEAAIKTIEAVAESLKKRLDHPKVVVCIQTDGEENASGREYTWERLKRLVSEKQEQGWQFTFLGSGIDAYAQGAKMGISAHSTMSYNSADRGATRKAFAATASNAASFAAGRSFNASYSMEQRRGSGDAYIPDHLKGLKETLDDAAKLDLTTSAPTPKATPTPRATPKDRGTIADFEL